MLVIQVNRIMCVRYVRIFQQFNSNAIQMAYRIFLLDLFFKRLFSNMHNPISRIRIPI